VAGKKVKGAWTVGYAGCAIDKQACLPAGGESKPMLNDIQRKKLLTIARDSIESYLKKGKTLEVSENDPVLLKEFGCFVTLREKDELRGCIGQMTGRKPLYLNVRDLAVESAVNDPRFPEMTLPELKDIDIEISVLSPLERAGSIDDIQIPKHGVLVKNGYNSGVFLPQVAVETGWSKEEFLSQLCSQKAGLKPDAWKDKNTELYIFSAEVFSEKDFRSGDK
jgi:hypothetical protein